MFLLCRQTSKEFWLPWPSFVRVEIYYRIAGNFCGVFISAILRFLSATAELKTAEYFSFTSLTLVIHTYTQPWPGAISNMYYFYKHVCHYRLPKWENSSENTYLFTCRLNDWLINCGIDTKRVFCHLLKLVWLYALAWFSANMDHWKVSYTADQLID